MSRSGKYLNSMNNPEVYKYYTDEQTRNIGIDMMDQIKYITEVVFENLKDNGTEGQIEKILIHPILLNRLMRYNKELANIPSVNGENGATFMGYRLEPTLKTNFYEVVIKYSSEPEDNSNNDEDPPEQPDEAGNNGKGEEDGKGDETELEDD